MTYLWILLGVFIVCFVWPSIIIYILLTRPKYKKRYAACVSEVDEAIQDILKASRIIMEHSDPAQIDAVVVETVMKNVLVQRIFTQGGVLYIKETNPEWIQKRLDIVKTNQIK